MASTAVGLLAAAPAVARFARLDTGDIRAQTPLVFAALVEKDKVAERAEGVRRKKSGYHAELVRCLESMETGAHGRVGKSLAERWLPGVRKCPGNVRRHKECGQLSFHGSKCDHELCPWCQARRSKRLRQRIVPAVEAMMRPMLLTFSPPNLDRLTPGAVAALQSALAKLHRQVFLKGSADSHGLPYRARTCLGGFRSIEVTNRGNGWNLHCHELVDSDWLAHYPQTDIRWVAEPYWLVVEKVWPRSDLATGVLVGKHWVIERRAGRWEVVNRHPGLAREFTRVCQSYPELREIGHCLAGRHEGFDLDCPDCWYFVDLRRAKVSAVAEIAKYVVKGSQVVKAGPAAVVDYHFAMKGKQLFKPFGKYHGFKLDGDDEESDGDTRGPGEERCPWEDCPKPWDTGWEYVSKGYPAGAELVWDPWARSSRVVFDSG